MKYQAPPSNPRQVWKEMSSSNATQWRDDDDYTFTSLLELTHFLHGGRQLSKLITFKPLNMTATS
jgi:hypothetical protein